MRLAVPVIALSLLVVLASCISKPACVDPYVAVGGECCVDADKNGVCDEREGAKADMPSVDELQRQVDELLNLTSATQAPNASASAPAAASNVSTNVTASAASPEIADTPALDSGVERLMIAPFAFAVDKDLPDFTVLERRAIAESELSYTFEGFTKIQLLKLGYEASYMENLSKGTQTVWQAVLRFNSSEGARKFVSDRVSLYDDKLATDFEPSEFRTLFDSTDYLVAGEKSVLLVRRKNIAILLLFGGFSAGKLEDLASAMEIRFAIDKTPLSPPSDVIPDRPSYVGPGPYRFASGVRTSTSDSVTLGIENVTFVKKGSDWGELSRITFVVDNQGTTDLVPILTVWAWDQDDGSYLPNEEVANIEVLKPGQYLRKTANLSLSISRINKTKTFRVTLRDGLIRDSNDFLSLTEERSFK